MRGAGFCRPLDIRFHSVKIRARQYAKNQNNSEKRKRLIVLGIFNVSEVASLEAIFNCFDSNESSGKIIDNRIS